MRRQPGYKKRADKAYHVDVDELGNDSASELEQRLVQLFDDPIVSQLGFGFEDEVDPVQAQAARESLKLSNEVLRLMRAQAEEALTDLSGTPVPGPSVS